MQKALAAAVIAGAVAVTGMASAQDRITVPPPILTLDLEALFDGSRAAERVSAEIERRTEELTAENRQIEAALTAEELDLTERRASLEPDAFRKLADAFDEKVEGIRLSQDAKARELARLRDEERQNFIRQITPILAEIVRERGAVAVLDRRTVILSADSIDITEAAVERINRALEGEDPASAPEAPQQP